MHYLLSFLFVVGYKFLLNFIALIKIKKFHSTYIDYIEKIKDPEWTKIREKILQNQTDIIQILTKCGVKDFGVFITTPTGYGHVEHKQVSILQNLQFVGQLGEFNIPSTIDIYLIQAKGILKKRMIEAFSPLYWINTLIFLPQNIITYLGFSLDNKKTEAIMKVINVIYWIVAILIPVLMQLFGVVISIHII
ncbi:TPA: hypothetical protein I8028_001970 [Legionella pneumophila]|uniref:hypothetical protein n=1 Tax=Legionella pneumophila TaxID=446 RepID=UPI000647B710|nr:hypothetical protein [Legionella pneumophila]HAT9118339.1 hypothetical protein [Legionella pneumophila subsp. pneumophila]MDI9844098.1 hypothetical protein [Legionella pneumophila]HAT1932904.1 hypothetical protein [Legionella pneumophila]HAT2102878.1 hypothetical protein [Legionella pneumophila]HAT3990527.1 hypothetical protein [Legionella pneumophila]